MTHSNHRPDPDHLLKQIQEDVLASGRGHLKVFFGACAGVGKTYAMLRHAQQKSQEGVQVVVGVVETHGRSETADLLQGLECIELAQITYRERVFAELNIDRILQMRPELVLVDELAHTNVPGVRHKKRWQDVEEILDAGINVYTTLNVQHLESLNDVVGQITGIRVRETIPDRFFENADEVALVDISPDELMRRMEDGKVYIPRQALKASQAFFRKGNLIALRELALRRTADSVDSKMREYRTGRGIMQVWPTKERLLVCIGPNPSSERLVRAAARIAQALHAEWIAVYIETPELVALSVDNRQHIFTSLKIAQEMGAQTSTVSGTDLAQALVGFAKERNVTSIVLGKSKKKEWWRWQGKMLADEVSALEPSLLLHVIPEDGLPPKSTKRTTDVRPLRWRDYAMPLAIVVAVSLLCTVLHDNLDLANIIMVYLVVVVYVAYRFGRNPGLFTSVLAVLSFDIFFVPPRFSLTVHDSRHLMTFAIMFGVASLVGTLTSKLKFQATVAAKREHRADILYQIGHDLANSLTVEKTVEVAVRHLSAYFSLRCMVLLPDAMGKLQMPVVADNAISVDAGVAQWCLENRKPAGAGTDTLAQSTLRYIPLSGTMKVRGVIAIEVVSSDVFAVPEQVRLLDSIATQIGQTLERIHYIEVAQDSIVKMETERLRNTLLTSVSHDIRTPLAALIGQTGNLLTLRDASETYVRKVAAGIHQEAERLGNIVRNILDMASLQAGRIELKKVWQPIDEVIGVSIAEIQRQFPEVIIDSDIPHSTPLLEIDGILFERVFSNLLGNAVKYAANNKPIKVVARTFPDEIRLMVEDQGPGIPQSQQVSVFEKFKRGNEESPQPGVGLGLSICKAIVEAHAGQIWVENSMPCGARFVISMPRLMPPDDIRRAWFNEGVAHE